MDEILVVTGDLPFLIDNVDTFSGRFKGCIQEGECLFRLSFRRNGDLFGKLAISYIRKEDSELPRCWGKCIDLIMVFEGR